MLLSGENVNQEALLCYAREAADFGTNYQLPTLDYATNHCGQPDVAMFDFTSMHASENAALVRERFGHQLLVALVGDSLLEVRNGQRETPRPALWCLVSFQPVFNTYPVQNWHIFQSCWRRLQ